MISPALVTLLRKRFALDWHGIHGAAHWTRVRHIGLSLAADTGAQPRVVELFAFLHDSCRKNDDKDPNHGSRAALLAERVNTRVLLLTEVELSLLVQACIGHSDGEVHSDITINTCWDADRLDLPRIGIRPDPTRLCTSRAREPAFMNWAVSFSERNAA